MEFTAARLNRMSVGEAQSEEAKCEVTNQARRTAQKEQARQATIQRIDLPRTDKQ